MKMPHFKMDLSKKTAFDIFCVSPSSATPFSTPSEISVGNKQGVWLEFKIQGMCQAALRPLLVNLKSVNLIFLEWHWYGGEGGVLVAASLVNLWKNLL